MCSICYSQVSTNLKLCTSTLKKHVLFSMLHNKTFFYKKTHLPLPISNLFLCNRLKTIVILFRLRNGLILEYPLANVGFALTIAL